VGASLSGRNLNLASIILARASVSALDNPKPFLASGRVQTFQNSTMFCVV
jgi:hypothetical protein